MWDTPQNGSPFGLILAEPSSKSFDAGLSTEKYLQMIGSWRGRLKEELEKKDGEIVGITITDQIVLDKLREIQINREAVRGSVIDETSKRLQFLARFTNLEDALGVIREHTDDMQAISAEFSKVQKIRTDKRKVMTQRFKEALLLLEKIRINQETCRTEAKDRMSLQYRKTAEYGTEILRAQNQMVTNDRDLSEKILSAQSRRVRLDDLRSSLDTEQCTRGLLVKDMERTDTSGRDNRSSLAVANEEGRILTETLESFKDDNGRLCAAADSYATKALDISSAIKSHQEDHLAKENVLHDQQNGYVLRVGSKKSRLDDLEAVLLKLRREIADGSAANESSGNFVAEVSERLARLHEEKNGALGTLGVASAKVTSMLDFVGVRDHDHAQELDLLKSQTQVLMAKQSDVDGTLLSLASKNTEEKTRIEGQEGLEDLQARVRRLRDANNEGSSFEQTSAEMQKLKRNNAELRQGLEQVEADVATWSGSRKTKEQALEEQKNEAQKLNDWLKSAKKKLAENKKFSDRLAQSSEVDEMLSQRLAQQKELAASVKTRRAECDQEVSKGVLMVKHRESNEIRLENLNKEVKALQEERRKVEARLKMAAPLQSPVKRQLKVQGTDSKSPAKRPFRVSQRTYQEEEEEVSSQPSVSDSDDSAFSLHIPALSAMPSRKPRESRVPVLATRALTSRRDADNESHRGYQTMDDF